MKTTLGNELNDIADQIEREQEALVRETEDVSGRDGDVLAWVDEHGGLEAVRKMADIALDVYQRLVDGNAGPEMLKTDADTIDAMMAEIDEAIVKRGKERTTALALLDESVPRVTYERHIIKRQRQIDESHAALRRRNDMLARYREANEALLERAAAMKRRLMPEGMEWPRFEDGEPVRVGDEFAERIYGNPCKVGHFAINKHAFLIFDEEDVNDCEAIDHGTHKRVKRPAALAADGEPLREGETVWNVKTGERYVVGAFAGGCVNVSDSRGGGLQLLPSQLTHERPESWERIEEDAGCTATKYNERRGTIFTTKQQVARDLVRRCRALAEREMGER